MSGTDRLYLDHAATTPVLPEARSAMADALEKWANPSSPHAEGRRVRQALEADRRELAEVWRWRHDVIFTSGASEAIQIVAARARADRRIIGPTEHSAVIAAMGSGATILQADPQGLIDLAHLARQLEAGPALVAIQLVNNETGVIQPIARIEPIVREAGSLLLVDCAQAAGKIDLPEADFLAISGHKFGAPPGVGALLVRSLENLETSGGQERGYRRGTENWPAIAAMRAALSSRVYAAAMPRLERLRRKLEREIAAEGGLTIGANAPRIATIGAYAIPGVASTSQLVQLDLAGIAVSAGSACSSGSMKPSHVLSAMGLSPDIAASTIRVSFGPGTEDVHVDRFLAEWRTMARRAQAA